MGNETNINKGQGFSTFYPCPLDLRKAGSENCFCHPFVKKAVDEKAQELNVSPEEYIDSIRRLEEEHPEEFEEVVSNSGLIYQAIFESACVRT